MPQYRKEKIADTLSIVHAYQGRISVKTGATHRVSDIGVTLQKYSKRSVR